MNFLYPKFEKETHETVENSANTRVYPSTNQDLNFSEVSLPKGTKVSVIRENIGINCEWFLVKIIDKALANNVIFKQEFYVPKKDLVNIGSKQTYEPSFLPENNININEPEIDPNLKEILIPYVDRRNGLYSVRIQVDQERIIDNILFEKTLRDVFYEGMNILLASRGFKSDNATIESLINKFYTFGYINKDLDLTVNRRCERLTFTVSLPLNFFNATKEEERPIPRATKFLRFTSENFLLNVNSLLDLLTIKSGDILRLTYPDKIIENFVLDFEILFIKKFAVSANEMFSGVGFPIRTKDFTSFELGFSNDLDLIYVKIEKNNEIIYLPTGFISQAKLLSSFYSKRVFNYLMNLGSMRVDINNLEIYDFILKYVKYPDARLGNATVIINNEVLPTEKLKLFNEIFNSQSEQCISFSEVAGLIENVDGIVNDVETSKKIVFGDSLFHLYVDSIEEEQPISIIDTFNDEINWMKESIPTNEERKEQKDEFSIRVVAEDKTSKSVEKNLSESFQSIEEQTSRGNENALSILKKKYSFSSQTLFYIANRIKFNDFLFQHIFCYLKGINPDSQEAKIITSTTPESIIRYFYYIYRNRNIKGKELIKLIATGLPIDFDLFCSKNQELIYFIKGLLVFVNGISSFNIPEFVTSLVSFNESNTTEPYKAYREALILETEKIATDILFEIIRDILQYSCEEGNLFNTGNDDFRDPFATHTPLKGFGGKSSNNDKNIINKNRENVLNDVYSKELQLQYGFDSEFQINLLDKLIVDIRCILSPAEGVSLLQGKPTPLVITLITNLIKNKYSKPPDDLSFLLVDKDKLKLFFKKLGLTVDKEYLTEIVPIIINGYSSSDLCDPQQVKAREFLLENKIPKNLGVLEDQLRRRAIKARTIFERIQNGQIEIPFNPFCPDQFGDEVAESNTYILEQYSKQIRKIFEPSLDLFNSEARKLPSVYEDTENAFRIDSNNRVFDSLEYKTYNSTLAKNLSLGFLQNIGFSTNKFIFYPNLISKEELSNIYLPESMIETLAIGCETTPSINDEFNAFLDGDKTGLYIEVITVDRTFEDASVDNELTTNFWADDESKFGKELLQKKVFMTVTVDIDRPWAANTDQIEFKLFYRDHANGRYKVLKNIQWQGDLKDNPLFKDTAGDFFDDNYVSSEDFAQTVINIITNTYWSAYEAPISGDVAGLVFGWKEGVNGLVTYTDDSDSNDIAKITKQALDFIAEDPNKNAYLGWGSATKKIIEFVYNTYFKTIIKQIANYEEIESNRSLLERNGLFKIEQEVDGSGEDKKIINKILVSSVKSENGTPAIAIKEFARFEQKVGEDFKENLYFTNTTDAREAIKSFIGYNLELSYFKTFSSAYDYTISNFNSANGENKSISTKDIAYDESFKETYLQSDSYKFSYLDKNNIPKINYSKFSIFDYPKDPRHYVCNITPHYFNIDRFISDALNNAKTEVCKGFDPIMDNMIKEIAVNLIFRTFVTDLLIKAIPFFTVATDTDEINKAHLNNSYVEILKSIMIKDLETFGGINKQTGESLSVKYFLKAVNEIFASNKEKNKLLNEFNIDENPVNYFIRKEIRHFMKFSLQKGVFKSKNLINPFYKVPKGIQIDTSTIDNKKRLSINNNDFSIPKEKEDIFNISDNLIVGGEKNKYVNWDNPDYFSSLVFDFFANKSNNVEDFYNCQYETKVFDGGKSFVRVLKDTSLNFEDVFLPNNYKKAEQIVKKTYQPVFESLLAYFIMASTVDYKKRNIFGATKQKLLNILFSVSQIDPSSQEDADLIQQTTDPSQEDVIKFLNDLSTSDNPALLINLKPQYSKYIIYFLEQMLIFNRNTTLAIADTSDKNIYLTRRINKAISAIQTLIWSATPEESRNSLISENSNLAQKIFWKRLESGKSIILDSLVSAGISFAGLPTTELGSKYLLYDNLLEGVWLTRAVEDIRTSLGLTAEQDPCEIVQNVPATVRNTLVCTPQNKINLIKEIDSLEEP